MMSTKSSPFPRLFAWSISSFRNFAKPKIASPINAEKQSFFAAFEGLMAHTVNLAVKFED